MKKIFSSQNENNFSAQRNFRMFVYLEIIQEILFILTRLKYQLSFQSSKYGIYRNRQNISLIMRIKF
jgi:hypothetical protein